MQLPDFYWPFQFFLAIVLFANPALGQNAEMDEMELIQQVAQLQQQLASTSIADRDMAEEALIRLGPQVLNYLEEPESDTTSDTLARLARVRVALEKVAVANVTRASRISLKGKMKLGDVLAGIQNQSGNEVLVPERLRSEKEVSVDWNETEFWVAINDLMEQATLELNPYSGRSGQLRLTPVSNPAKADSQRSTAPHHHAGVFNLTVTRVNASRNLVNSNLSHSSLTVLIRWEPRIRPISLSLPVASVKAVDEFDSAINIPNREAVLPGAVQSAIPELEFSIPIGLIDRQVEVIKSFSAEMKAVLPGRIETFRFKQLGDLDEGAEQQKAGAIVTFGGYEKNDELYGVKVRLSFDHEHNALESHQGWAYENQVYLENGNQDQFEPVAFELLRQDNEEFVIRYYFDRDPSKLNLVYRTPALIVNVPIKIEFNKIPLP